MSIDDEKPAILKPDGDMDPREHITFRGQTPDHLTCRGRITIDVLGLDSARHSGRARHFTEILLKCATWILHSGSDDPGKRFDAEVARRSIEEAVRPDMPYSAMVAAYLKANPLQEPAAETVRGTGGAAN
jgi:hypothetical protein